MDIRLLQYFLMVAREDNITRAATLLHITQPTLSRQLMQLEEELGTKLFIRSNHNVLLTDEGLLFRRRAQDIVSIMEKAKGEITQSTDTLTGMISLGFCKLHIVKELAKLYLINESNTYESMELQLYEPQKSQGDSRETVWTARIQIKDSYDYT